nr:MAG TPA: DNA packaging protein [Caudoviricetes sp.]
MTLYTSKVVAQHLNLTERRVRQLRDEGVIQEKRTGLYDLVDTMTRYIKYIGAGSKADLTDERAKLTKAKREAAEMENRVRKAELLEVGDVEKAYSTVMMNFRSRILALPQKLAPAVAALEGDEQQIQDLIQAELQEALETLSHAEAALAEPEGEADEEEKAADAE